MRDFVIAEPASCGVYHVSAEPIDKYELLKLVAAPTAKTSTIAPDDKLVIDRSLDSADSARRPATRRRHGRSSCVAMHDFG